MQKNLHIRTFCCNFAPKSCYMKRARIHSIWMVSMLLLASCYVYAADNHYFRLSVDLAYARDFSRSGGVFDPTVTMGLADAQAIIGSGIMEPLNQSNGFSPALGIGYRLAHNHFRLDVGLGAEYRQRYNMPADLTNVYERGIDEQGFDYMGHHMWTQRTCVMRHIGVNVPVMVGGEWSRFYFLAGVKAAVDLWGTNTEQGKYSLTADYERYMDPFSGMDNHGFVTESPYSCDPVVQPLSWNVRACAEVGYCVAGAEEVRGKKTQTKWYVGLFGEYGVIGTKEAYTPLLVGVRLTMLMPLPELKTCMCWGY